MILTREATFSHSKYENKDEDVFIFLINNTYDPAKLSSFLFQYQNLILSYHPYFQKSQVRK
jgi:hypothetical protein